jgi:hypothetical protein
MERSSYQQEWQMDSEGHKFVDTHEPEIVFKILSLVKQFDDTCLEARSKMYKEINKLLKAPQSYK